MFFAVFLVPVDNIRPRVIKSAAALGLLALDLEFKVVSYS